MPIDKNNMGMYTFRKNVFCKTIFFEPSRATGATQTSALIKIAKRDVTERLMRFRGKAKIAADFSQLFSRKAFQRSSSKRAD